LDACGTWEQTVAGLRQQGDNMAAFRRTCPALPTYGTKVISPQRRRER
jgi:hypothetical protein